MFVFVFVFLLIFGYVFSFLCLVDKRSSAGFVFVFLLETYLCFCVWLTREIYYWVCVCVLAGDRFVFCVLGSMFLCLCSCLLCFRLVFYVLGLCSWICVLVVLGSRSGSEFFFFLISRHVIFCFKFFYLVKINKLVFLI